LNCLFFLFLLFFHFSFFFFLNGEMFAIALPLLSISPFISNFDAFSPQNTCCFNQKQSDIKARLIKEMSLCIFLMM